MKWKLDENLGSRTVHLFLKAGHDAETVLQEELSGSSDETLFEVCVREDRCLLTLDIDFADVLRFPPHQTAGIAVLRLPVAGARLGNRPGAPLDRRNSSGGLGPPEAGGGSRR